MQPLYFITGNKNKLIEAQQVVPELEQLDIDLPEIQSLNPKEIIEAKLKKALETGHSNIIVEDVSLTFENLNGLPGPLIKWFLKSIDVKGLAKLAKDFDATKAVAKAIVGYAKSSDEIYFFEHNIPGTIVDPRGENGFGWDSIFLPDGDTKTFAELTMEEKAKYNMRVAAFKELSKFIKQ